MYKKYRINQWLLDPEQLTLSGDADEVRLESRVMQVLLCLIQHANQVVSRDTLIDEVWRGGTVSDNAINRIIGLLRQSLGDNAKAPQFIRTVPKKGYVLIAAVEVIELNGMDSTAVNAPAQAKSPEPVAPLTVAERETRGRVAPSASLDSKSSNPLHHDAPAYLVPAVRSWRAMLPFMVFILAIIGVFFWFWHQQTPAQAIPLAGNDIMQVKPLTFFEGQELDPALANGGEKLAFAYRTLTANQWQLRVLSLAEQRVIEVPSFFDGNNRYPAWSRDGRYLAYLNWGSAAGCQLVVQDMHALATAPRTFGCETNTQSTSIAWAPSGNALYYIDADNAESTGFKRLFRLNLLDSHREQLSQPHVAGQGDYAIALAPDAGSIAVLRSVNWFDTQILLFNLQTGEWRNLAEVNYPLRSVAWAADGKALVYRGDAGQLYRLTINPRQLTRITSVVSELNSPTSNVSGQLMAVAGELFEEELWLWQAPLTHAPKRWVFSSRRDYSPAIDHDGAALVFVSNRSGLPQLWLRQADGQEQQLTQLTSFSHIAELSFSADNQQVCGTINRAAFVFDIKRSQLQFVPHMGQVQNVAWGLNSQQLIAAVSADGMWQIRAFDIATGNNTLVLNDAFSAKYDSAGVLYFSRLRQPGIWRIQQGNITQVSADFTPYMGAAWQLAQGKLWLIERGEQPQLVRIDLQSGVVDSLPIAMKNVSYRSLSVSNKGDVVLPMLAKSNTDIVSVMH